MARRLMVTRTFTTTIAEVLMVNVNTNETTVKEVKVPRTYADVRALFRAIVKSNEDLTLKPVHIMSQRTEETLYGMDEAKFIELAEVLPPRTTNADTEATENN